jgi:hypothetical protein
MKPSVPATGLQLLQAAAHLSTTSLQAHSPDLVHLGLSQQSHGLFSSIAASARTHTNVIPI